jgi:hypothetical protein
MIHHLSKTHHPLIWRSAPACDYTVKELKEGKYLVEALTRLSHELSNYHSKAFSGNLDKLA